MNQPKYKIGDRLANSNMIVRGVMTDSKGNHRYFIQMFDNSIVIDEWYIDKAIEIVNRKLRSAA
jgi:hypothetical protein